MSRGPLFLSAASGLASLAVSNPTALSDLTGCGVRIGHNSAAEVLQAAMGRTVARSWSRQSWADARAPAGQGSSCGPPVARRVQIGQRCPICQRQSLKFGKTLIFQNYQGLYGFTRENGCKICANVQTLGRNFVYFRPCFRAFSLVQWYRGRRDCLQPGPPVRGTRAAADMLQKGVS